MSICGNYIDMHVFIRIFDNVEVGWRQQDFKLPVFLTVASLRSLMVCILSTREDYLGPETHPSVTNYFK